MKILHVDIHKVRRLRSQLVTASFAVLGCTATAAAQDAPTPDDRDGELTQIQTRQDQSELAMRFDDILVTGHKQPESLQDAPVSATVFDQEQLDSRGVFNVNTLQLITPNFSQTSNNFGGSFFKIRGVGRDLVGGSAESGVAFHVNQVYLQEGNTAQFFDLEQVEILRGPQGTLLGRNAVGGAINVVTARPVFDYEARADITSASNSTYIAEFMLNTPVSDDLAFRFAATFLKSEGYTENLVTGNMLNGGEDFSLRASALWKPADATTVNLVMEYGRELGSSLQGEKRLCKRDPIGNLGCLPDELGNDLPNFLATLGGLTSFVDLDPFTPGTQSLLDAGVDPYETALNPADIRQVAMNFDPKAQSRNFYSILELSHETDNFSFESVTGYVTTEGRYIEDNDHAAPTLRFNTVPGIFDAGSIPVSRPDPANLGSLDGNILGNSPIIFSLTQGDSDSKQWFQELRLRSRLDGPFNFVLGGNFFDYDSSSNFYTINTSFDAIAVSAQGISDFLVANGFQAQPDPLLLPFLRIETPTNDITSLAAFGEGYYDVSDTLTLTAGMRLTRDRKTYVTRETLLAPLEPFERDKLSYTAVTGNAGFDWKPETGWSNDLLLYGFFSRGFKAGGFNAGDTDSPTFSPEYVNSVEAGLKTTISGNFRANLSGFRYNYNDLQIDRVVNRSTRTDNIDAEIYGAEAELLYAPTERLVFNAAIGLLNTSIKNGTSVDQRDPTGGDANLIAIKDITNATNCVATLTQLFVLMDGVPFGDCDDLSLSNGVAVNLRGNELPNAPKWSLSLGAQYSHPVTEDYNLTVRADYVARSDFWARAFNRAPVDRVEGWSRTNMYLEISSKTKPLYARLTVSNLFDSEDITGLYSAGPTAGNAINAFYLPPRSVALTIGGQF